MKIMLAYIMADGIKDTGHFYKTEPKANNDNLNQIYERNKKIFKRKSADKFLESLQ